MIKATKKINSCMKSKEMNTVQLDDRGRLWLVNIQTGAKVKMINIAGEIVNGPFIVNDVFSVTYKNHNVKKAYTIRLSNGIIKNSWAV